MVQRPDAILIAGPTASGKSKLAVEKALQWNGEIVNTDSMQIYPVLDILTARPDRGDLLRVPHHLYGFAQLDEPYSAALWLEQARQTAEDIWSRDSVPVFVGGTGLYFRAIEEGLAQIPDIPAEIRKAVRSRLKSDGSEVLHRELAQLDPNGAAHLKPGDSHRIARALEVVAATGRPLAHYQSQKGHSPIILEKSVEKIVLMPERQVLHQRINLRTDQMLDGGALDEVKAILALNLPPESTVLKAIGVRQLESFLYGEQAFNEAKEQIKAATRQYAKRQSTWFNGQFDDSWRFCDPIG